MLSKFPSKKAIANAPALFIPNPDYVPKVKRPRTDGGSNLIASKFVLFSCLLPLLTLLLLRTPRAPFPIVPKKEKSEKSVRIAAPSSEAEGSASKGKVRIASEILFLACC